MRLPIASQSYQARALPHSCSRLVNLYAERGAPDGKDPFVLYGTPGLASWATAGSGPMRGREKMGGVLYVVSGTAVYSVTSTGTATLIPGVPVDGSGPVGMASNGTQIAVVTDQGTGYIVTSASVVAITDADFPGATSVGFLDGLTTYVRPSTQVFFTSELNAAGTILGTDFASAEAKPDNLVTHVVANRQVWLFGEETTEVWFNAGGTGFPLARIQGSVMEKGAAGRTAAVAADNSVFWVGNDRIVYRAEGFVPIRVSHHGVEEALRKASDVSDVRAWTYSQAGHTFVGFTFPTAGMCFVYDASTGLWHERESYGLPRWRVEWVTEAFGKVLAGDYSSNVIWQLDLDTYTESSSTLVSKAVFPALWNQYQRATMFAFFLDLETGVGLNTGQGSDPQVMLRLSDDGGRTWSEEMWTGMGATGEYPTRAAWWQLGQFGSQGRVMEVSISDPVKRSIMGAYAEVQGDRV